MAPKAEGASGSFQLDQQQLTFFQAASTATCLLDIVLRARIDHESWRKEDKVRDETHQKQKSQLAYTFYNPI
jgi:hypothetical protein